MSIRLFLQIGWGRLVSLGDFSTLRGVPLAGDSYRSSKRRYAAVTHFQTLQPIGNKHCLFLEYNITTVWLTFSNHYRPFLRPRSSCYTNKSPIYLV